MTPDTIPFILFGGALLILCSLWAIARAVSRVKFGRRFWWFGDDDE